MFSKVCDHSLSNTDIISVVLNLSHMKFNSNGVEMKTPRSYKEFNANKQPVKSICNYVEINIPESDRCKIIETLLAVDFSNVQCPDGYNIVKVNENLDKCIVRKTPTNKFPSGFKSIHFTISKERLSSILMVDTETLLAIHIEILNIAEHVKLKLHECTDNKNGSSISRTFQSYDQHDKDQLYIPVFLKLQHIFGWNKFISELLVNMTAYNYSQDELKAKKAAANRKLRISQGETVYNCKSKIVDGKVNKQFVKRKTPRKSNLPKLKAQTIQFLSNESTEKVQNFSLKPEHSILTSEYSINELNVTNETIYTNSSNLALVDKHNPQNTSKSKIFDNAFNESTRTVTSELFRVLETSFNEVPQFINATSVDHANNNQMVQMYQQGCIVVQETVPMCSEFANSILNEIFDIDFDDSTSQNQKITEGNDIGCFLDCAFFQKLNESASSSEEIPPDIIKKMNEFGLNLDDIKNDYFIIR